MNTMYEVILKPGHNSKSKTAAKTIAIVPSRRAGIKMAARVRQIAKDLQLPVPAFDIAPVNAFGAEAEAATLHLQG